MIKEHPSPPSEQAQSADTLTIRALLPWMGLVLLLIILPYLLAWAMTPPAHQFMASLVIPSDTSVYFSAIRQGKAGDWLYHYTFSPEPIAPAFVYFPYLLMGHLLRPFNGSVTVGFHLMRLAGSVLAMLSFLYWVRVIFPRQRRVQLTVWLLIVFGSGLGWLAAILLQLPLKTFPDLGVPEWSVFLTMLGTPHFAFGLAVQTTFFASVVQMVRGENGRFSFLLPATAAFLLGLFYTFNLIVISVALALYVLVRTVQARRILWTDWINSLLIAIPVLPFLFYYGVWVQRDANWKLTQSTGNIIPPPMLWTMLVAMGLLAPLSFIGGWRWLKERRDPSVLIWAAVMLLLIYVPVPYAGRFLMGIAVPVATLAGFGLETAVLPALSRRKIYTTLEKVSPTPYDTIRRLILILTVPSTIMVVIFLSQMGMLRPNYPLYLPTADTNAAFWFAENSDAEALIMAGYDMGNYLPRVSNSRVFIGQSFLTVDFEGKLEQSAEFWHKDTSPARREQLIERWDINYLYYGTLEQAMAGGNDIKLPGRIVYEEDGVTIYDVSEGG